MFHLCTICYRRPKGTSSLVRRRVNIIHVYVPTLRLTKVYISAPSILELSPHELVV